MTASVLELLSVVGKLNLSGDAGFSQAVRLATGGTADNFAAKSIRRDLEGLGHVRTVFGSVGQVLVLAPMLCLLPGGTTSCCQAILSGARTQRLVDELKFLCTKSCHIKVKIFDQGTCLPEKILLEGAYQHLLSMAEKLRVDISDDPTIPDSWRLLQTVKPLGEILNQIIGSQTGFDTIQNIPDSFHVYDPSGGAFKVWKFVAQNFNSSFLLIRKTPYDYRFAWKQSNDLWRLRLEPLHLDPRWAMWAVRMATGVEDLHLPCPTGWAFAVPARCPLPTELHQVACLCSGLIPQNNGDQIEYQDVPPIIQQSIREKLAIGDLLQETKLCMTP